MPTGNLPKHAKEIYTAAEESALQGTCKGDKECAAKIAWSAVKNKYKKVGDKWVLKSDAEEAFAEFSFVITKAAFDKASGEMRWSAVASDTDVDSYGERMSLELFKDFIKRSDSGEKPPANFCSEYWCGGLPYPSIAHYSDLDGRAVPGRITKLYIDGNRLKAQGVFHDSDLGRACFKSICNDLYGEKSGQDKVRISIGFLDWAHKHGVVLFERKSLTEKCPLCASGVGDKQYVRGHLIHLALTRVPVNTRTDIEPVLRSEVEEMATRKSDAASIIGEELAEEIDQEAKLVGKSEAIEEPVLIERAEGHMMTEDEMRKKCDGDEECMKKMREKQKAMKAKSESEECETCGEETPEAVEEGSQPEVAVVEVEAKSEGEPVAYSPLGGARSWEEVDAYEAAQEQVGRIYDSWYTLNVMAQNIMNGPEDGKQKLQMMKAALSGCQKKLEMKALTALEQFSLVQKSDTVSIAPHALDSAIVALKSDFDRVVASEGASEEKLHALDAPLTNLVELIRSSIVVKKEEPELETAVPSNEIVELRNMIQSLADSVKVLTVQKSTQSGAPVVPQPATPQRRSVVPSLVQKSTPQPEKQNSFRAVARRNSGLPY